MNFKAKRVHHAKKEGRHRINTCTTPKPEKVKEFIRVLQEVLPCPANTSAAQRWEYLRNTIYNAALLTFDKKQTKTADWFEAHLDKIQPFIDEQRRVLASYKARPVRGHSKCLGRPQAKSNRFQGVVQMTFGFSCAIKNRSVLIQAI